MKKKKYEMNIDAADSILQQVFAASDRLPNSVPFDKLVLREKLNTRFYDRAMAAFALTLLLTFLSPLVIVPLAELLDTKAGSEAVRLVDDYIAEGCLYLQLEGDAVLYEDAYLETTDGKRYPVISYDAGSGILCFPYIETTEANIYIPIEGASDFHLLLSPQ